MIKSKAVKTAKKNIPKHSPKKVLKKKVIKEKTVPVSKRMVVAKVPVIKGVKEEIALVKKAKLRPSKKIKALTANPLNIYKANLGYNKGSRAKTFTFLDNVFASMRNNTNYLTPSPVISDIQDEIKLYYKARVAGNTDLSDQLFVNILYMTKQLGVYVANNCLNDLNIFLSSGFKANQPNTRLNLSMGKVQIKKVEDTKMSCEAKVTMYRMPGATNYEGYYQEVFIDEVTGIITYGPMIFECSGLGIKMVFKKLPFGKRVLLYVRAVGPKNEGDLSDGFPWLPR
jgi:hypothetical protein